MGSNQGLHNYTKWKWHKTLNNLYSLSNYEKNIIGINRKGKIKFRLN